MGLSFKTEKVITMSNKEKLTYFNVLYICNEINLCLIYREGYSETSLSKSKTTLDDIFMRIMENLHEENLKIIDNKLILEHKTSRFLHTHVIENQKSTDFKLYYTDEIDEFIKAIDGNNNISVEKDYDGDIHIDYIEGIKLGNIREIVGEYYSLKSYKNIKEQMIKDNTFSFSPYCIWENEYEIDKSKITYEKQEITFVVENLQKKINKD